jgi:L-threonylcarbamoyladenylate synthase
MNDFFRIRKAADILETGGVIAYPTEGVYGIGCLPHNADGLERILNIKGRKSDAGFILIAASLELLAGWITPDEEEFNALLEPAAHPTTWIVTANPAVNPVLSGGRPTLAVRLTDHPLAAALSEQTGGPLVSTSANRSGKPAARSGLEARLKLGLSLDGVLYGRLGDATGPSEIRMAKGNEVLRPYADPIS